MLFIVFLVVLVLAILLTSALAAGSDVSWSVPIGLIVVTAIMTTIFSATTVSARSVGIQTAFGRYQGTLDNGLQFTAPWSGVEEFSTQVQTMKLDGGEDNYPNIGVRFAGGGEGTITATINWQISDKEAKKLWERFKTFERVEKDLVAAKAETAVKQAVGSRTPNKALDGAELAPMGTDVRNSLQAAVAEYGVVIVDATVRDVIPDDRTRESISKTQSANQDVERAKADQKRAEIDAKTAEIRQKSGALSEQANQRYCLEIVNNWDANKNGPIGVSFNCNLNGNSSTPTLVTPTK